ncbi:flavoprotein [Solwaraspora sp. WMMA2065]|uniref:flavoprotein n=1 Tax=Solwaraspora sp. WMMA2065 TaxID=3015166 RepID=UPI00338F7261
MPTDHDWHRQTDAVPGFLRRSADSQHRRVRRPVAGRRMVGVPDRHAYCGDLDRHGQARIPDRFPVASRLRAPDEPGTLPRADAVVVAPASFNTINKWASGISDNLALGVLNEALGTGLPIVVSPYAKPALTQHPAYRASVRTLSYVGVQFTEDEALKPPIGSDRFRWGVVAEAFRATD